jgi:hypothetical protein
MRGVSQILFVLKFNSLIDRLGKSKQYSLFNHMFVSKISSCARTVAANTKVPALFTERVDLTNFLEQGYTCQMPMDYRNTGESFANTWKMTRSRP